MTKNNLDTAHKVLTFAAFAVAVAGAVVRYLRDK